MTPRLRIWTKEPEIINGFSTVQHWQLMFDGFFIADTSVPEHLDKWKELMQLVNNSPAEL
jgi:hypothetical protein